MGSNYEKNIYKHLQETIEKVDLLSLEIVNLKIQHRKDMEIMKSKIFQLTNENEMLRNENQTLKDIINKNSGNSSKPPSSDGFIKIHNSREKSGKHPGGQKGHNGNVPKLFENPDEIKDIKPFKCKCGGIIKYTDKYTAKQLVDIETRTKIIEYREHEGVCECCRTKTDNRAPINDLITYGNNIKSFSAMLSVEGMVSINRIKQILSEITCGLLNLSEGTISKWNSDLSRAIQPSIDSIKEKLALSSVNNKDETSIRVNKKTHWLHVLSNSKYTYYFSHLKRGKEADDAMGILPSFNGVLVHDHWKSLYDFNCGHAECNAHILRYLKAVIENKKRVWAEDMIKLLLYAKDLIVDYNGKPPDPCDIDFVYRRYDEILKHGHIEYLCGEKSDYNGEDMKLLRRLKEYKTEHLRFFTDISVPFDNNQAERDLRMIKAKTKISGCFRGIDGGVVFSRLKSYTSTLKKNKLNIFNGLNRAFSNMPVVY
jgi:regulator of replication initiation timing